MRRLTLFVCLLAAATLSAQETETSDTRYQNSPWQAVPADPFTRYILTPIPRSTPLDQEDFVTGSLLSVDGQDHALESNSLRVGCWLERLPAGSVLADPLSYAPATATRMMNGFLFHAPSTELTWGPVFPPYAYRVKPGDQVFLVSQISNSGSVPLGQVTCVAQVYYRQTDAP